MNCSFLGHLASELTIMLLIALSEVHLVNIDDSEFFENASCQQRAHCETCKIGMVASIFTIECVSVNLSDQECTWGIPDIEHIDAQPSSLGQKAERLAALHGIVEI